MGALIWTLLLLSCANMNYKIVISSLFEEYWVETVLAWAIWSIKVSAWKYCQEDGCSGWLLRVSPVCGMQGHATSCILGRSQDVPSVSYWLLFLIDSWLVSWAPSARIYDTDLCRYPISSMICWLYCYKWNVSELSKSWLSPLSSAVPKKKWSKFWFPSEVVLSCVLLCSCQWCPN